MSPEETELERLNFETLPSDRKLTHRVVRFPAKFHPPVARQLILDFTAEGETIVEPFCGSGTLMVEAAVAKRNAIGFDVDPFSVFVAHTKCQRININELKNAAAKLLADAADFERPQSDYVRFMHDDISVDEMTAELGELEAPAIPNLHHWFRNYVTVDLARLRACVDAADGPRTAKNVFKMVFLSIIRLASNADPTPVSGLERTKHIIERDENGRLVNPFELFRSRLTRTLADFENYAEARDPKARCRAAVGDATQPFKLREDESINAAITSPPYHGAVDYYRRHQLEMFWGGFTDSQDERLALLDRYLGRPIVPQRHRYVMNTDLAVWPKAATSERQIREVSPERANGFRRCIACLPVTATAERRRQRKHPVYAKPELIAKAPNTVWSWDITKLRGPAKWNHFALYVVMDIFSRYAVGWTVQERESGAVAAALLERCARQQNAGSGLVVHADNGGPMRSKPLAYLLADLGMTKSHSRPHTSNDNPFSEAQFKTLKYCPQFPGSFANVFAARVFCREFFAYYNEVHRHSGIGMLTPADVHYGRAGEVLAGRARVLSAAYGAHPERFVRHKPQPKAVPTEVWINKPKDSCAASETEVIAA